MADKNADPPVNYKKFCRPKIISLYELLHTRRLPEEVTQKRICSLIAALLNLYCPPILPIDRELELHRAGKPVWTAKKVKNSLDYMP
jgi:hypothetical protein